MSCNVVVLGGAGYIGSTLVPILLDIGYDVTVYDLLLWGVDPLFSVAKNPRLHIVKGDIRNISLLSKIMRDKSVIINLVSVMGYPTWEKNGRQTVEINNTGAQNITDLLTKDQKLIYASTGSFYRAVTGICSDNTNISPLTLYSNTKADGEKLVIKAGGVALRLATAFGLSHLLRLDLLVNDMTYRALKSKTFDLYDGSIWCTFLHVQDVARAFIFTLQNYDKMRGQTFNVGDKDMNMKKSEVAKIIQIKVPGCVIKESSFGTDYDTQENEVSYASISRLGYKASISVEEGVEEMLKIFPFVDEKMLPARTNVAYD